MRLGPGAEFDRIRRILQNAPPSNDAVLVGPGDDCAVVRAERVALSADLSVEGVHFQRAWLSAEDIGWRATNAALSDLAACAATPIGVLAVLAVAPGDASAERVMAGVSEAARVHHAALLGGDLTRSPGPLILDIIVAGQVETPLLRSGARPGDALWVTGTLGGAAAAVYDWQAGRTPDPAAARAFMRPHARIAEAFWLAQRASPHAMIDLSDGLAGDAGHLAAASAVRIIIEATALPIHPAARASPAGGLTLALGGGEDYELCFAAPAGAVEAIADEFARAFALPLQRVGFVAEGSGVALRDADGNIGAMPVTGFNHFAAEHT